ncbi:zinc finger protein 572-like [Anopheles nili]|uniref:zinc finger protein 572-like n=1 Tax=Anopheles nili TaxID=185578 RepID=UPI00237A96EC|nr:zinc finger protein 572-like [Anopheles nili]
MDVESRSAKEESRNDTRVGTGGADVREDTGEGDPGEDENRQQQQHHRTKTIYALNMNVCRLCLSEGQGGHLQPVYYAQDTPDEILQQKILELTTVEITYATDFPTGVCIDCLARLDEFSLFRRQCIDNNEILKLKYYELKADAAEEEGYACKQEQKDEEDRKNEPTGSRLARVKKEEEFIDLAGSDRHNGEHGERETMDEEIAPFGTDSAGNEIIISDGHDEFGERAGTKIQYLAEDGTMTEYITAGAIVRRGASPELEDPSAEGHEIYYTVGPDTYAIPAGGDGAYPCPAGNYVPQGFENQTEIECTTVEDHLPEEYVEEGPAAVAGSAVVPGASTAGALAGSRGRYDRPFVCKHCKTSFKYEHNYDRHMKNHAKVLYRCGKCSKTFVKLRKCQQHHLKAHSSQRYECDICYRTYSLPTRLENHVIEMHSVNGVYRCDRCQGELFSSYLDFKAHRMRYHPRNNDTSAGGGASGADAGTPAIIKQTPYGDVVHMDNVLSRSPTPSSGSDEQLGKGAVTLPRTRRQSAIRTVTSITTPTTRTRTRTNGRVGRPPKQAPPVPVVPQQQDVILIDDDEQQQGAGSQQLNGTGAPVVHRELLQQIEESEANSIGPKTYTCESCSKTFVHLNNLKAHIYAEHDNDKPFKCKVCPISFKTKEILVMHMLLHTKNGGAT